MIKYQKNKQTCTNAFFLQLCFKNALLNFWPTVRHWGFKSVVVVRLFVLILYCSHHSFSLDSFKIRSCNNNFSHLPKTTSYVSCNYVMLLLYLEFRHNYSKNKRKQKNLCWKWHSSDLFLASWSQRLHFMKQVIAINYWDVRWNLPSSCQKTIIILLIHKQNIFLFHKLQLYLIQL